MIKVTVTIDGAEKKIDIPTNWNEINYGLYCKLSTAHDESDFISRLLDIDREQLLKAKINGLEKLIATLKYITIEPEINDSPEMLGDIFIPKNIEIESYDQYACFNSVLAKQTNALDIEVLTKYAAIYCQPLSKKYGGAFDFGKAMEFSEDLKKYKAIEVISVARFFLSKWVNLKTGLSMNYLLSRTRTKKYRRGSRILIKLGRGIRHSIKSPVMLALKMMSWLNGRYKSFILSSSSWHGKVILKDGTGK